MKILIIKLCLTILPWYSWCCKSKDPVEIQFKNFIKTFNKTYKGTEEYQKRYVIFAENLKEVHRLNKDANGKTKYKINEYNDLSWPEFKSKLLMRVPPPSMEFTSNYNYSTPIRQARIPQAVDYSWSFPPIKNQGTCGSCWAFSTTSIVESALKRRFGISVRLSEQQLVDCADETGNQGCAGGWPYNALRYIEHSGINTEYTYPYVGYQRQCRPHAYKYNVSQVIRIPNDEEAMLNYLANHGPFSVAIATGRGFRYNDGNMMSWEACGAAPGDVDHAVTVVGYGTSSEGIRYWTFRNSWGPSWGDNGYFHAPRGGNWCRIRTAPVGVFL